MWRAWEVAPNAFIHETAIVRFPVKLGIGVIIGPNVEIGEGVSIGDYSVIGGRPEHRNFYDDVKGERTKGVWIEKGVTISEFVTIHAGTLAPTKIRHNAAIFQHAHIAHDVEIEDSATIGGKVSIAGHCIVMPYATISGHSCLHQWCVVGPYAFLGAASYLKGHMPPGELWMGNPARPAGHNNVGLQRNNLTIEECNDGWRNLYEIHKERALL